MNVPSLRTNFLLLAGRAVLVLIHKSGFIGLNGPDNQARTTCSTLLKGSFSCRCDPGFTEGVNRDMCIDVDECNDGTHLCSEYGNWSAQD